MYAPPVVVDCRGRGPRDVSEPDPDPEDAVAAEDEEPPLPVTEPVRSDRAAMPAWEGDAGAAAVVEGDWIDEDAARRPGRAFLAPPEAPDANDEEDDDAATAAWSACSSRLSSSLKLPPPLPLLAPCPPPPLPAMDRGVRALNPSPPLPPPPLFKSTLSDPSPPRGVTPGLEDEDEEGAALAAAPARFRADIVAVAWWRGVAVCVGPCSLQRSICAHA